jgi:DsbC/DsbD-like thiol-disulfide interchange protein
MCSDRCIPNSKELTLSLPVGEGKPANAEVFDKYRKLVPQKAAELPDNAVAKVDTSGSATTFTITITPPAGKNVVAEGHEGVHGAYFYPNDLDGYVIEPPKVTGKTKDAGGVKVFEGPATITYSAEPNVNSAEPAKKVSGTLVYQTMTGSTKDKPVLVEVP